MSIGLTIHLFNQVRDMSFEVRQEGLRRGGGLYPCHFTPVSEKLRIKCHVFSDEIFGIVSMMKPNLGVELEVLTIRRTGQHSAFSLRMGFPGTLSRACCVFYHVFYLLVSSVGGWLGQKSTSAA